MAKKQKTVKKKKKNDFLRLAKHIKFPWLLIILALVVGSVQSIVAGKIPDATGSLFDGEFSTERLMSVIGTLILSLVIGIVSYVIRVFAEAKSVLVAKNTVWGKMMNVQTEFFDDHDPNSMLSMITVDSQVLGGGMVQLFVYIPTMAILCLTCVLQLLAYNPMLLLILVVLLPIHILYFIFLGGWQYRVGKELNIEIGELTGYLAERIRNLPLVKAFSKQKKECDNGRIAAKKLYDVNIKFRLIETVTHTYILGTPVISTVLSTLWGAFLLKSGQIDVPTLVSFVAYIATINTTIMVVSIVWVFVKDFGGRSFRLAKLFDAQDENSKVATDATVLDNGDVVFDNVSFSYGKQFNVLNNVSFTVPCGKATALVGPSGSGKTTVVKLLERLYYPSEGAITINGMNINDVNVQALRRKIAYVVQDSGVFSGTLRESLCYGVDREVSDEELDNVTKLTGIYDYISSLADKYNTDLAGWGASLSGGQRQRIVIARALLRNSDILIFDEPTSALDPETANAISELIFKSFKDKTVLIISHELNYIAGADNIVVLSDGKLLGEGQHEKLMKECKLYNELVEEQSYKEVFAQ